MAKTHLRPVRPEGFDDADTGREGSAVEGPDRPRWVPVALGLALVVTLALLVWSRLQMGDQISVLSDQIAELEAEVARRDELILAQDRRITDVRTDINRLHELVNAPLD